MATNAEPETPGPNSAPNDGAATGTSVIAQADPRQLRKLSEEFALILKEFEVETVTLREVLALLHGRGYVLLVMVLALPFCQPIPLPGLSTPLGLIIAIIGARLAMGWKPWLPKRLLDLRLPPKLFAKVFQLTQKIVLWFERLLRPRLLWITASPRREQLHAAPIVVCALLPRRGVNRSERPGVWRRFAYRKRYRIAYGRKGCWNSAPVGTHWENTRRAGVARRPAREEKAPSLSASSPAP